MLKIPPLSIVTEYTITVLKKQRHRLYYKIFWYLRQEKQIYSMRLTFIARLTIFA